MSFELFVARRYLTARRKEAFVSVITLISVVGVAIGVAALVIAIALITGFQGDVQAKILGATSHIMVSDLGGRGLENYDDMARQIRALPGVESASAVVYNTVLLTARGESSGALVKGLDFDRERPGSAWLQKLEAGRIPEARSGGREGLLLGRELALRLGAQVGDTVQIVTASSTLGPTGLLPKRKTFEVAGIFNTGLYEFDSSTALVPIATAQRLFGLEGRASYIQVRLRDIFAAPETARKILAALPPVVYITTWMELNKSLFSALKLEKNILFLTITLIVVVAALNIIATLILMVMEKTRDIGILMAIGATPAMINRIFFFQGALIGVVGTALGAGLGLGWCALANAFKLIRIPVDIYQISYVPFRMHPLDLAAIVGVTLLISFVSTLFPARRAAKVDPVVALKYE
ncbi:MAG TPA: ABC transporter permease [Candidatus Aminicenantes bacterium]|nr:ABC transporter permease [Candidatus Aminicenantes bacterium]HRY66064.1 ABC transporter permease [Candidatus Aminicenantes bacterium]HRZ72887.1 ABC transporter permease [Candidatus Aminicenantes bacterium]